MTNVTKPAEKFRLVVSGTDANLIGLIDNVATSLGIGCYSFDEYDGTCDCGCKFAIEFMSHSNTILDLFESRLAVLGPVHIERFTVD